MSSTLIVYVHGALSTRNSWNYIRQNLQDLFDCSLAAGLSNDRPHEEFIKYDLNKETSPEIVEGMILKVHDWVEKNDIKKLFLIGHSFGGVLAVQTIRDLEEFL